MELGIPGFSQDSFYMLPFWSLNSKITVNIFTRGDLGGLWWRLLREIWIVSCDEDSEDVIRVDSCAFHPL